MQKIALVAVLLLAACDQPKTVAGFPLGATRQEAEQAAEKLGFEFEDCFSEGERARSLLLEMGRDTSQVLKHLDEQEYCNLTKDAQYYGLLFRRDTLVAVGSPIPGRDRFDLRWDSIE